MTPRSQTSMTLLWPCTALALASGWRNWPAAGPTPRLLPSAQPPLAPAESAGSGSKQPGSPTTTACWLSPRCCVTHRGQNDRRHPPTRHDLDGALRLGAAAVGGRGGTGYLGPV